MDDQALRFGPNGGLVFCMEWVIESIEWRMNFVCFRYFERNLDWLHEQLGDEEDDYFLFDCPGKDGLCCILNHYLRLKVKLNCILMSRWCVVWWINYKTGISVCAVCFSSMLNSASSNRNFSVGCSPPFHRWFNSKFPSFTSYRKSTSSPNKIKNDWKSSFIPFSLLVYPFDHSDSSIRMSIN